MTFQVLLNVYGNDPVERYFNSEDERNQFANEFECSMYDKGITLIESPRHPLFLSFNLIKCGEKIGYITFYL